MGQQQDLLRKIDGALGVQSPTLAPGPPDTDALLRQIDGVIGATVPESAPKPPKQKTPEELNREMDAHLGWADLLATQIATGIVSPVSALFTSDLKKKTDNFLSQARRQVLKDPKTTDMANAIRGGLTGVSMTGPPEMRWLAKILAPRVTPESLVGATETTSHVAGQAASSLMPQFQGGTALFKPDIAKGLTERVIRQTAAGIVNGGQLTAMMRLEPGESRAAAIAKNAVISGASEVLLAPLFFRSWRDELGVAAGTKLTKEVADRFGVHPQVAEGMLTELRAGSSTNVALAEQVVKASSIIPGVKDSPVAVQAKKRLEVTFGKLLPKQPTKIDRSLFHTNPNFGIQMDVYVNGQKFPISIRSSKEDLGAFSRGMDKLRDRVSQLSEQGADIRFDNITVHSIGTWNRFKNYMTGKVGDAGAIVKPGDLPGSAPVGSVGEHGNVPKAGTPVRVEGDTPGQTKTGVVADLSEGPEIVVARSDQPGGFRDWMINDLRKKDVGELQQQYAEAVRSQQRSRRLGYTDDLEIGERHLKLIRQVMEERKIAPASVNIAPPAAQGQVNVKTPDGKIESVPMSKVFRVDLGKPVEPLQLLPHSDGSERRFVVHLNQKDVSFEGMNQAPENNYFRSNFFEEIDPSADLGHDVRGYVHDDGSMSLSVPQVQRKWQETQYGQRSEGGPLDTVFARTHGGRNTETRLIPLAGRQKGASFRVQRSEPSYSGGTPEVNYELTDIGGDEALQTASRIETRSGKVVLKVHSPMSFGAGFTPRKMQTVQFAAPKWMGVSDKVATPIEGIEKTFVPEPPVIQSVKVGGPVTAQARQKSSKLSQVETPQFVHQGYRATPSYAWLTPQMKDVPELITARDTARVLLKRGVSPETKVRVRASKTSHAGNGLIEAPWTLRELSQYEPHMVNLDTLRSEASNRGYTFIPQGRGGILRDNVTGADKVFEHQLEAAEHLGRIPLDNLGPKLEDPLEQAWQMGWYRSFDADVDTGRFLGTDAQETGINELIGAKRPLITVWSSDEEALVRSLRQIEQTAQLPPHTFSFQRLDPEKVGFGAGQSRPYALMDPAAVKRTLGALRQPLEALGIENKGIEQTIRDLQDLPNGLDVLKGRDPESALVYSFLRKHKMKDEWELGKVQSDGLGNYRVYDPEMKQALFQKIQGASRDFEPTDDEISDIIGWPADVEHAPHSTEEPGMWEDHTEFYGEQGPVGPYILQDKPPVEPPKKFPVGMKFFRVPAELFKEVEARTGVPFWTSWQSLQSMKEKVESSLAPAYTVLNDWKNQYPKQVREQAQMIFETRMAGKPVVDLTKASHPSAEGAADQLEQAWRTFLGEMDYGDQDMREFFATFPQLRKQRGDWKAFVGGRQGLPKLMRSLGESFNNGEIRITDRETDGFVLARRIMRMVSQEKHLNPTWNRVRDTMHAWTNSEPGIPKDFFNYFERHLFSIKRAPDDLQISINRFTDRMFQKLGWTKLDSEHVGDFVSFITGVNYSANMAWRPGLVLRNLFNTLQTTYPVLGEKYTGKGMTYGIKWLKDPVKQEEMIRRGIIPRDALSQNFSDVSDFIANAEMGRAGRFGEGLVNFMKKGTSWYKSVEDFNRVVAYQGQYQLARDSAEKVIKGEKDWAWFLAHSKLDTHDVKNGPLIQAVERLLMQEKNPEAAAHLMGMNFTNRTQFSYARENMPMMMQSTAGRLLGQYGNWSMAYIEYMRGMTTRGSAANRFAAISRWVAMNAALYYTAEEVFGVDAKRWLFFSPMSYTGGPIAQLGLQGLAAGSMLMQGQMGMQRSWEAGKPMPDYGERPDAATSILAGRFNPSNLLKQFTPGFGAAKDIYGFLTEEEFSEAVKRLLTLPSNQPKARPNGIEVQ